MSPMPSGLPLAVTKLEGNANFKLIWDFYKFSFFYSLFYCISIAFLYIFFSLICFLLWFPFFLFLKANVTRSNFPCNLQRHRVALQVARKTSLCDTPCLELNVIFLSLLLSFYPRSVLAVLFRTNKLALFAMQNLSSTWKEITNLTESHYAQLTKEHYFVDNDIMKGKLPPDARTAVGNKKTWQSFQEWQRRKYLLHFTCIEWCPSAVICLNQVKNTLFKFVFLATTVKSGQLFLWNGKAPLTDSQTALNRVLATHTSMFYPCSLAWSTITATGGT